MANYCYYQCTMKLVIKTDEDATAGEHFKVVAFDTDDEFKTWADSEGVDYSKYWWDAEVMPFNDLLIENCICNG